MSSEWLTRTFSELMDQGVLEIGDGYRAKNDELGGDGLIFLRAGHVKDSHIDFSGVDKFKTADQSRFGRKISKAGDVVITTKGNSTGRLAVVTPEMPAFVYSPHLSYWRSMSGVVLDQGFLRAWARSDEFSAQLEALSRSTDMAPYLSLSDQRRLQITLPSIGAQSDIAFLNDAVSKRLELLRETNTTLEAIAQSLFKSWFVDFDPVYAKQQGIAPAGMDDATAALFPDGFEESALGLVPKGWRVGSVSEFARQQRGSINPLSNPGTMYKHFSLPAFDKEQMPVFERGVEIKSNKTVVTADSVLLSKLNPHIPRVWLPIDAGRHAVCSTEFLVFVPVSGATREFIYCTFRASSFQERLCQLVTGTSNSHQRVKPDGVSSMGAVVPPASVLGAFASVVRPVFERIGQNRRQAQTLATLRDTLLPRLISGQLRLPEAEEQLAEAIA